MKPLVAMLLIAGLLPLAPAASAAAQASVAGRWTLDTSRLPMAPAARPKSVTIRFSDAGGGQWTTHVDILGGDGSESHAVGTATLDGAPASVQGSPEADIAAIRMPAPNVLVFVLSKGGVPGSTRIYSVQPDGQHMVETAAYYGEHGMPILKTFYYSRVR